MRFHTHEVCGEGVAGIRVRVVRNIYFRIASPTPQRTPRNAGAETELPLLKNILRKRDGFTLVELVVVIVVLLILMAIAVPSYLAVRDNARESGTKSDLTVAYKNVKAALAESVDGSTAPAQADLVTALGQAEPGLTFVGIDAADVDLDGDDSAFEAAFVPSAGTIYVHVDDPATPDAEPENVVLLAQSATGSVFAIGETDTGAQIKSW